MNETKATFNRKKSFKIFFILLIFVLLAYLAYEFSIGMHYETTDNAYVSAPQLQISSQVEGTISAVLVAETQSVKTGDTLYRIDMTESKIASEMADADLIKAVKTVRSLVLMVEQRKHDLDRASQDYQRKLAVKGAAAYSVEEIEHLKTQFEISKNLYNQALESAYGITRFEKIASHPDIMRALGQVKKNYVSLIRSEVKAPVDAVVAKRNAQVGQRVIPGTILAGLILDDSMWVDANFKENQLANIRIGQPVELEADIYGSKVNFPGKVIGFSPGTGASLALLPAQNATGNWVKVVQRLPVRIQIDAETLKKYPLKVGLSMVAKIDIANRSGLPLESMQQSEQISTKIFEQQSLDADKHALSIFVKANQ
jgi:membrane fusion protein (multidrug efflux system)